MEYINIAATAVSSLPVSPRLITRLTRQQHATADRHCESTVTALSHFCTDDDDDDDDDDDESSISS